MPSSEKKQNKSALASCYIDAGSQIFARAIFFLPKALGDSWANAFLRTLLHKKSAL